MLRREVLGAGAVLAASAGLALLGTARAAERPTHFAGLNKRIPKFQAPLLDGGVLRDSDFKGRWSVVLFWGAWCPDCVADAPHTAALARAIAQDPSLRFVTVHVDNRFGRWKGIKEFYAEQNFSLPTALDPDRAVFKAWGVSWTPTYLVVGPDRVIRDFRTDFSVLPGDQGVKHYLRDIAALKKSVKA